MTTTIATTRSWDFFDLPFFAPTLFSPSYNSFLQKNLIIKLHGSFIVTGRAMKTLIYAPDTRMSIFAKQKNPIIHVCT